MQLPDCHEQARVPTRQFRPPGPPGPRLALTRPRPRRLEDISHEKGARRGLGLGQGYGTQIRVTDQRARIVADAIVGLPLSV